MSTIGITVPVGSPTALALAIELLTKVEAAHDTIQQEITDTFAGVIAPSHMTVGTLSDVPAQLAAEDKVEAIVAGLAQSTAELTLDKDGLPWDARIHSDAAEKLSAKGVWKRKRGVSDELVAQVEAELRAGLAVGTTDAPATQVEAAAPVVETPSAPPAPPAPTAPEPVKVLQVVGGIDLAAYRNAGWTDEQLVANGHAEWVEQAPAAPAVPTPPAPPAPPAAPAAPIASGEADPTDWNGVASWVTKLQAKGVTLTPPELDSTAKGLGLSMLPELANRPELIPQFVAAIKQLKGL